MNQKSKLALLLGLTLAAGATAKADAAAHNLFPVNAPNCNLAISQPDNSSGVYLNNDCTAAFVLPPKSGTVRVESADAIGNLEMCTGLSRARLRVERYQAQAERLLERLMTARLSSQEQEDIRKNLALITDMIRNQLEPYDGVPAATVQISYTYPSMDEWIGQFLRRNPNVGADYGLKFYAAPISDGVLVFSALDQIKDKIKLSPVVRATIPGMVPVNSDPTKFVGTGIVSNGDSSGQLVLSLAGVCGSEAAQVEEIDVKDVQSLAANLVANVTYTVPVMASVGYTARLDSDIALQNWTKSSANRTQFTKNESAELFSKGEAGLAFQFEITDYGSRINSDEDKANFYAKIRDEVRLRLASALVEQMELAGFLEMGTPAPRADAPEPGTVDQVRTRTECHGSSGFLGIGASHRCNEVPYIVKVPHGSDATVYLSKINNTTFNNTETVLINEIAHRVHTGSFLPEKK